MKQERRLIVEADGNTVADGCHVRVQGKRTPNLYPDLFILNIWNLSEKGFHALGNASELRVYHWNDLIAFGDISEVTRREVPDGELTTVSFGAGLKLWESFVSLSVPSYSSAGDTLQSILAASATGIALVGSPKKNLVYTRGQSFHGRTVDAIERVLADVGERGSLHPVGLLLGDPDWPEKEERFVLDNHDGPWIMEKR